MSTSLRVALALAALTLTAVAVPLGHDRSRDEDASAAGASAIPSLAAANGTPGWVGPQAAPTVDYDWPVPDPHVLRAFDAPAEPWLPGHRGVDLAAHEGEEILAAAAGTVAFAGPVAGRGVVSIDHVDGIRTTYEPVDPAVGSGEVVTRGAVIGRLSPTPRTGHGLGSGLHWGARRGETYLDPTGLVSEVVIRLLQ